MNRKLRVSVDQDVCVGNGTCVTIAPGVFEHDEERLSVVKDQRGGTSEQILEAAEQCPVSAIRVEDEESGEVLFP